MAGMTPDRDDPVAPSPAATDPGEADGVESGGVGVERPIRLAIVDDDALVRAGLRILVGGSPEIEVVAEAGDGDEAIRVADAHWPDVMLMDVRMPGWTGWSPPGGSGSGRTRRR